MVETVFEAKDGMGYVGEVGGSYDVMSSPTLELRLDADEINGGESIEAYGHVDQVGKEVKISYQLGETVSNFKVATDGSVDFSHTFTPDKTGDWQVSAHFAGDDACHPGSSETLSFTVSSMSTSLTCALSEEEIELGKEVTISGEFSFGMAGLKVELEATSSDNVTELQATTSADGGYGVTFKPDSKGI